MSDDTLKDVIIDSDTAAVGDAVASTPVGASVTTVAKAAKRTLTGRELTGREQQVAGMDASGLKNSAIAGILHVAESTVKGTISRIREKLGLEGRQQPITAELIEAHTTATAPAPKAAKTSKASASATPAAVAPIPSAAAKEKEPRKQRKARQPKQPKTPPVPPSGDEHVVQSAPPVAAQTYEAREISFGQKRQVRAYIRMGFTMEGILEEAQDAHMPLRGVQRYVEFLAADRGVADKPMEHLREVLRNEERERLQRPIPAPYKSFRSELSQ